MKYLLSVLCFVLILSGCASSKTVYVQNMKHSNLNYNGDNVPVTVVFYQLKDIAKFQEASAVDLISREDIVLGRDKIDSARLQIAPDDEVKLGTVNKKDVAYVGILAIFNDIKGKKLKSAILTKKISGKELFFSITSHGLSIEGKKNKTRELIRGK